MYSQIHTQYIPQFPLYYPSQPYYYNVGSTVLNDQLTTSQSLPQGGIQSTGYSNIQSIYEQTGNGVVIPSVTSGVSLDNNEISTVATTTTPSYETIPSLYVNNNAGLIPLISPPMINNNYMTIPSSFQVLPVRNYNPLGIGSFIINNNVI